MSTKGTSNKTSTVHVCLKKVLGSVGISGYENLNKDTTEVFLILQYFKPEQPKEWYKTQTFIAHKAIPNDQIRSKAKI